MGIALSRELLSSLKALKFRIGPVSTTAEAEPLWPLALRIDASIDMENPVGPLGRQASQALLWAVSDLIKTLRRAEEPDVDRVKEALVGLEVKLASGSVYSDAGSIPVHRIPSPRGA